MHAGGTRGAAPSRDRHSGRREAAPAVRDCGTFETRTMRRQLRTAQMRELVEQLARVETLGQGAHFGGPDDDDAKRRRRRRRLKTQMKNGRSPSTNLRRRLGAWRGFKTVVPKEGDATARWARRWLCSARSCTTRFSRKRRGTPGLRRGDRRRCWARCTGAADAHAVSAGKGYVEAAHVHAERRVFVARARLRDARRVAGGRADRYASNHVPAAAGPAVRERRVETGREPTRRRRRRFTKKKKT